MQKLILAAFLFFLTVPLAAQVGAWKSYTDMKNVGDLAFADGEVWAATSGGVFVYRRAANAFQRFTNIEGLASIAVTAVAADAGGRLFAGSSSGYLNLLDPHGGAWATIPDIARATSKPQRGVNKLVIAGDRLYVAVDFGVVVYFPDRGEFGDTYVKFGDLPSPAKVNDIWLNQGRIWIATDKGIADAPLDAPNLQEPSVWSTFWPGNGSIVSNALSIGEIGNTQVAGTDKGGVYFDGSAWTPLGLPTQDPVTRIFRRGDQELYLVTPSAIYRMRSPQDIAPFVTSANFSSPAAFSFSSMAPFGPDTLVVGSTAGIAFVRVQSPGSGIPFLKPNGPNANQFIGMMVDDAGTLWSGSGNSPGYGVYGLADSTWINYYTAANPVMGADSYIRGDRGANGSRWFSSWGSGILLMRADGQLTRYSAENVPGFPGVGTSPNFNVTYGAAVDARGNTWIVHYRPTDEKVLSVFTKDSAWIFFRNRAIPGSILFNRIAIDSYGTKWMVVEDARGIATFNDNGTLTDVTDDRWDFISAADPASINAGTVTDIAVDRTGDIWIGTDIGLRTIFNPLNPRKVTETCHNTACNIEGQYINCIAVDALNNKWLGTRSGVFLLSPDGSALLAQYSTTNSPLLDDNVKSIAVHPVTGVAYFGTDYGLSSLATTSVAPVETARDLRIMPNPFHPEKEGPAMIDGLMEGATIKIFTLDGTLVAQLSTPGGRIGFWDGRARDGSVARSGVYFVAAYNADGTKVALGKIAVIR